MNEISPNLPNLKVSLIIPAYNEEKYIGECLKSAIKYSAGRFYEIVVVDNNSQDKTREIAATFPGVKVINETRQGVTRARQRGVQETTGELVAFIDADTIMTPTWYGQIQEEFKNPNLACLSGPYNYYDLPRWQQLLTTFYWRTIAFATYLIVGYMAIAGNLVIRRDVLNKMEGLDTSIEFYGDDTDTARRAHEFGKVHFIPAFSIGSSGRRLAEHGLIRTNTVYVLNYLWEVLFHRPATNKYEGYDK